MTPLATLALLLFGIRRRRVSVAGPFRPVAEAETAVGRFEMDLN